MANSSSDSGAQADGGALLDAAGDTIPSEGSVPLDGSEMGCVTASGYAICGGPQDCFPDALGGGQQGACAGCLLADDNYQPALCISAGDPVGPESPPAEDGYVYVEGEAPGVWEAVPFDVGQLFAANGAADRVRYADWSAWTNGPLPAPTTCPSFAGFSICGANCGTCGSGQICTGRSPFHPYGLCVGTASAGCSAPDWTCPANQACSVFRSDSADQALADDTGVCFATASCEAIAASYPGGAYCNTP